jgi:(E)-4-hydroxy-3-methylbut-2-enyl-diphosphate synthase
MARVHTEGDVRLPPVTAKVALSDEKTDEKTFIERCGQISSWKCFTVRYHVKHLKFKQGHSSRSSPNRINEMPLSYVPSPFAYSRRPTRVVMVGDVAVGGNHPIRVQSMTTTLTKDVAATAAQTERLVAAGCEIVRITTPTPDDARCLEGIRAILTTHGVRVPLVADIHFSPMAAMVAAEFADKVRVNPGNFVDSRKFAQREYTDAEYTAEVERMAERFTPLVLKCRERGVAMRIGTNHGSLSDRIMNRFGDTPEGMVESALEFVQVCAANNYHDIILSMKASNPKVMIAAYRLLAARLAALGMDYPFHLGVTEAGNAEDGRIKSAVGIGSLLEDGIGDTIRVSLTEEPEEEIPVAMAIADRYSTRAASTGRDPSSTMIPWNPYAFERRRAAQTHMGSATLGGDAPMAVIASVPGAIGMALDLRAQLLRWASPAGRRQPKPDAVWLNIISPSDIAVLRDVSQRLRALPDAELALLANVRDAAMAKAAAPHADAVAVPIDSQTQIEDLADLTVPLILVGTSLADVETLTEVAQGLGPRVVAMGLDVAGVERIPSHRLLAARSSERGVNLPIVLIAALRAPPHALAWLIEPSITLGSLLCDGIGDGVMIRGDGDTTTLAFNLLQASGARIFKADYVACPSCGRTLFDLQETTERIKTRTSHLVGVRIAIMGCIVNGPGEMADADFGYVGGAPGKVNLYVGKECVEKGVPAEQADDRLIELIRAHGRWVEPEADDLPAGAEPAPVG